MLNKYLQKIQEQHDPEYGKSGLPKKKPSPSFAYELIFGKPAPSNRRGRPPFPVDHKEWKGMTVDKHLKDKWLKDINNISNCEIRGSCEGHAKDWPTYIAFRILPKNDKNKSLLNKIVDRLNKGKHTKCGWDIGMQNRPRFICTCPFFYTGKNDKEWNEWWTTISSRLNKAINS